MAFEWKIIFTLTGEKWIWLLRLSKLKLKFQVLYLQGPAFMVYVCLSSSCKSRSLEGHMPEFTD